MNNAGKIGPPMNPLAWLTPKVSIFPMSRAISRPSPRVPASESTVLSWSLPVNRVSGSATPTSPKIAPPSVDFTTPGSFSRSNSMAESLTNVPRSVVTTAANRPSGTAASNCQSSNW